MEQLPVLEASLDDLLLQKTMSNNELGIIEYNLDKKQGELSQAKADTERYQAQALEEQSKAEFATEQNRQLEIQIDKAKKELQDTQLEADFVKKTDAIAKKIIYEDTIPYRKDSIGHFKNKKNFYYVPEEDLKSMIKNTRLADDFKKDFKELKEREKNIIQREYDNRNYFDNRYDELKKRERVIEQQEQQLEHQKSELAQYIEEKAQDLLDRFLSQHSHIRSIYYDFLKMERMYQQKQKAKQHQHYDLGR